MPTLTTNANNLTFTAANQQWVVQSGVVVGSPNSAFGAVVMPFANDELINNGILFVPQGTPFGGVGVFIGTNASGSKVTNADTGAITAPTGVSVSAGGVAVANAGSIIGYSGIGIDFMPGAGPTLENSGYIHGKTVAIRGTLIDSFTLTNSGVIDSDTDAILLLVNGKMVLTNTGKIKAADGSNALTAVGSGATVQLVNQGVIQGEIDLSDGADTFNGRGGVTKGVVFGAGGNDSLTGGGGNDEHHGENGADTISGRGGDDTLVGGAAGDTLKGRGGADDFVYKAVTDSSGNTDATRDTIIDFDGTEGDRIDVRPLDAKLGTGNQKFVFIGTNAFTGHKGELRYDVDNGDALVQADVTGDGKADMAILVNDMTKLVAEDFNL